ncbi:hypothetical protein D8S78_14790 [Natrialba swarupiae]|nr:hypothetical protein [Natrialba swarupiae]
MIRSNHSRQPRRFASGSRPTRGTRLDLDSNSDHRLVDEVVTAPVREAILHRRLRNLLVRRRQFERLEEQNEQLERFASVVSHDLRNPLQVAQGRLDLLESSVADSEREHVEHAQESLDRMDSLISDVLALARETNSRTQPRSSFRPSSQTPGRSSRARTPTSSPSTRARWSSPTPTDSRVSSRTCFETPSNTVEAT